MTKPANLRTMDPNRQGGFRCPACGGPSAVIDSRQSPEGIRRRRACHCGNRITTYESVTKSEHDLRGLLAKVRRAATELQDLRIAVCAMLARGDGSSPPEAVHDIPEKFCPPAAFLVAQDGELYPNEHNEEVDYVSC